MNQIPIYWQLLIASVKSRMEYRANFLIFIITILMFYAAQVFTIGVIMTRFKTIAGWSLGEMALLYSLLILSQGIAACFFSGLVDFTNFIREGTYDRLLLRPLSTLGQVIMGGFEIAGIGHLILGVATFFIALQFITIVWTPYAVLVFIFSVIGGSFILAGIRIIIAAIAFYAVNNSSLVHLFVYSSREFMMYPMSIYSKMVQFFLTFIFPLGFINYYPVNYFLDKDGGKLFHPYFVYLTFPVGLFVLILSLLIWKRGQFAYESAGA